MVDGVEVSSPTSIAGTRASRSDAAAMLSEALPALRRLARKLCDHTDDVHDLMQDTLERAVAQGMPAEIRSPRSWLKRIMLHLFIDRRRAASRNPDLVALDHHEARITGEDASAGEPAWARITVDDVIRALDEIEPPYREVYWLHTFADLSYQQIAGRLSIGSITVGTRLSRARRRLRAVLVQRFDLDLDR
jgi:RNA polymerase sigma-70 factor (ECF subfamily)